MPDEELLNQNNENQSRLADELRRLTKGVGSDDHVFGIGFARFHITTNEEASLVLRKVKEVLSIVLTRFQDKDASSAQVASILPGWLTKHFFHPTPEEGRKWLDNWSRMSLREREKYVLDQGNTRWSAEGWIDAIASNERTWYWWNAQIIDKQTIVLDVVITEWPFASEALQWLLKVSGAITVNWRKEDGLHWNYRG